MNITCDCGDVIPAEIATADLTQGVRLCPACAIDSAVPCDLCGRSAPVRLYGADGQDPRTTLGVGAYIAVCQDCDEGDL